MKRLFFIIPLFLFHSLAVAQEKRDYNWIIGYDDNSSIPGGNAIVIDFNKSMNNISNVVTVDGFNMEGSNTSMSDKDGNLLFYSNGCYIVNASHEIMENGDSINPGFLEKYYCSGGGSPWVQGVLALPAPESDSLYYVFVTDAQTTLQGIPGVFGVSVDHLYYNVIDISKNSGLGKVIAKNQVAIRDTLSRGYIQATRHANGVDWWVVVAEYHSNCFYSVLINKDGIQEPIKKCAGRIWSDYDGGAQAVFSPDGTKYVRMNGENGLNIYDFDNQTGDFSDPIVIDFPDQEFGLGGAAISPNSRYVYVSAYTKVFQFDLQAEDIAASRVTVAEWDGYRNPSPTIFYLAALAPDDKIYISSTSSTYNLHVINHPDCPGLACDLVQHGVTLPSFNFATIPNLPHYGNAPISAAPCTTATTAPSSPESAFELFPNPSDGLVTFSTDQHGEIILCNAMGKLLKTYTLTGSKTLDLSDLPSGLYIYTFRDADGSMISKKWIKL